MCDDAKTPSRSTLVMARHGYGQQGRRSFLKKRTKKLLQIVPSSCVKRGFFASFFKKEVLAFLSGVTLG
jgi:hypothetical protein